MSIMFLLHRVQHLCSTFFTTWREEGGLFC